MMEFPFWLNCPFKNKGSSHWQQFAPLKWPKVIQGELAIPVDISDRWQFTKGEKTKLNSTQCNIKQWAEIIAESSETHFHTRLQRRECHNLLSWEEINRDVTDSCDGFKSSHSDYSNTHIKGCHGLRGVNLAQMLYSPQINN